VIRHAHRLDLVVRDVHYRHSQPPLQRADLDTHVMPKLCVEIRERLVHQADRVLRHDRPRQRHALPLPARELLRLVVQPLRQPHQLGYALEALFPLIRRQAPHLQPEHDVLRDREVRKERVRLKYHRDAPPGRVERRHIAPFDEDLPFADLLEPGDQPQQRRLPAPRRPEQHHELALLGAKADFIDGLHCAEALRHFIQDDLRHAPPSRWD